MTKQEEIQKAFTNKILRRHPDMTLEDAEWEAIAYKRLLDKLGVVIKVDRKLPLSRYYREMHDPNAEITGFSSVERDAWNDLIEAGYVAVEPLLGGR